MADSLLAPIHREWQEALPGQFDIWPTKIKDLENFAPNEIDIFRNFQLPPSKTKVVIVGQDPYPTAGDAVGLAFSVKASRKNLPKSLKNIFTELYDDLGGNLRTNGDLSDWHKQGVSLMNTILTVGIGAPLSHQNLGWQELTCNALKVLADRGVVALLMGKPAAKFAEMFSNRVITPHPSPLSAYRGFFGSKPFSRINQLLAAEGKSSIKW